MNIISTIRRKKAEFDSLKNLKMSSFQRVRFFLLENRILRRPSVKFLESLRFDLNLNLNYLICGDGPMILPRTPADHFRDVLEEKELFFFYYNNSPIACYRILAEYLRIKQEKKDLIISELKAKNKSFPDENEKETDTFDELFKNSRIVYHHILEYFHREIETADDINRSFIESDELIKILNDELKAHNLKPIE